MSLASTMAHMTPAESIRLKPMRTPGPVRPKTFSINPQAPKKTKTTTPGQVALNPYDAFNVPLPYDATKIPGQATASYNADVANDTTLSQMGGLTPAQIDAQSKNRADQQTALGSSLAAALAGIGQAYVASGNTQADQLATQDATAGATATRAMGVAGAAPVDTAPVVAGTRASLATQTAAGGNLYGGLQAAALSSGDQAAKAAYAAGETTKQTQSADQQSRLAQLLSSLTPESGRESAMITANTGVQSANTATHLAIWQNLQNQELQAQASGDKRAIAAAQDATKRYTASLDAQTKKALGITTANTKTAIAAGANQTKVQVAKIAADAKKQAALLTAQSKAANGKTLSSSQKLALNRQITKIMQTAGGVKSPGGQVTSGYTVTLTPRTVNGQPDIVNKGTTTPITVDATTGKALKVGDPMPGYPGQTIGAVAAKTKTGSATVKNMPSAWTKWKRALGAVMETTGLPRTQATQYMAAAGYPAPKS